MVDSLESSNRTDMAISTRWSRRDRPIMMYVFMLLLAVMLVLNYFIKFPTFPDEAFAYFQEYHERKLPLQVDTGDGATLERYFANEGISFGILSLDHPGVTLRGGSVQQLLNHKACTYVYQGLGDSIFALLRYRGKIEELPAAAEIRWERNLRYYVYLRRGVAAVFWQTQDICSVLVSDASIDEIVGLAQVVQGLIGPKCGSILHGPSRFNSCIITFVDVLIALCARQGTGQLLLKPEFWSDQGSIFGAV